MKLSTSLLVISIAIGAMANQPSNEWRKRYDSLEKTYAQKNFSKWKGLVSDEYQWIQPDGKVVNRKDSIAMIEPMFKAKIFQVSETIKGISKRGGVVDVSFDMHLKVVMADGKTSGFHEIGVDSWRKFHGKWKLIGTRDKVAEETDGKS